MNCKQCIHYDMCGGFTPTDMDSDVFEYCREGRTDEIPDIEERCNSFKDKSRFIELPCKVGDVVWWTDGCTRFAHKVEVTRISYTAEYGFDMSGFTRNQTHKMFNERDIGKTVFLTREEAERALKGGAE